MLIVVVITLLVLIGLIVGLVGLVEYHPPIVPSLRAFGLSFCPCGTIVLHHAEKWHINHIKCGPCLDQLVKEYMHENTEALELSAGDPGLERALVENPNALITINLN